METCAAVIAEMLVIFIVHYAKALAAIGHTLAAVKTYFANIALLYCAKRSSAVKADVVVPIRGLHAVLSALAALALCLRLAAFLASVALIAEFKPVVKYASLAFFTVKAALFTVLCPLFFARAVCVIAVAALGAMHAAVQLLAALAEAAVVAKHTRTAFAEPAYSAKLALIRSMALLAAHAMGALCDVAFIAKMAFGAEFGTRVKACAAFPAMRCRPAVRRLRLYTAKSAFAKPVAKAICTAVHTVIAVLGKHGQCK